MSETKTEASNPSNRVALFGFLFNVAAWGVFFVIINQPIEPETTNASGTGAEAAMSGAMGIVFQFAGAATVSAFIMIVGSILCLIGLIWAPRKWSVAGLVIGPALVIAIGILRSMSA